MRNIRYCFLIVDFPTARGQLDILALKKDAVYVYVYMGVGQNREAFPTPSTPL